MDNKVKTASMFEINLVINSDSLLNIDIMMLDQFIVRFKFSVILNCNYNWPQ